MDGFGRAGSAPLRGRPRPYALASSPPLPFVPLPLSAETDSLPSIPLVRDHVQEGPPIVSTPILSVPWDL